MLSLYGKIYGVDNQTACKEIKDALGKNEMAPSYQVRKREIAPKEPEIESSPPAPDAVRHRTYSMFLSMLVLADTHRQNLLGRGFTERQIEENGYKSTPVFGFKKLTRKLLDAGCGCKPYRKLFDHCSGYIGMDIENPGHSHEMEDIDVYYDGLHFPFEDESFDSVFSSEVFEHAQHLDQIIQEINRVLRAGGKLLVSVPFVWNEHELPYDYRRYTSCGIKKLLESHGFQVMKMSKSTGYVEMIFQLWMEYVRSATQEKKRCYQIAAHILLIVPAAVAGAALAGLLPENDSLYGDTVVLCRKRKQSVKEQE